MACPLSFMRVALFLDKPTTYNSGRGWWQTMSTQTTLKNLQEWYKNKLVRFVQGTNFHAGFLIRGKG